MARQTKAEKQRDMADKVVANSKPEDLDNLSIDDLLGPDVDIPAHKKAVERKKKVMSDLSSIKIKGRGKLVYFKTQKGEPIIGIGIHYYVVRMDGKLHYKAADAVTFLPDGWKPGDAIPEMEQIQEEIQEEDLSA